MIQVPIRTTKPNFTLDCKPRCDTVSILLDNSVKVLWALYRRIHLQTYRAPIGAVFVSCLRIQLPGSCNRMYGADDRYIKLSSSCMRRYGAYEPRHETNGCLHKRNKDADQLRGNREIEHTFVFAIPRVQSLYFLNLKFQATSQLLLLYSPFCV